MRASRKGGPDASRMSMGHVSNAILAMHPRDDSARWPSADGANPPQKLFNKLIRSGSDNLPLRTRDEESDTGSGTSTLPLPKANSALLPERDNPGLLWARIGSLSAQSFDAPDEHEFEVERSSGAVNYRCHYRLLGLKSAPVFGVHSLGSLDSTSTISEHYLDSTTPSELEAADELTPIHSPHHNHPNHHHRLAECHLFGSAREHSPLVSRTVSSLIRTRSLCALDGVPLDCKLKPTHSARLSRLSSSLSSPDRWRGCEVGAGDGEAVLQGAGRSTAGGLLQMQVSASGRSMLRPRNPKCGKAAGLESTMGIWAGATQAALHAAQAVRPTPKLQAVLARSIRYTQGGVRAGSCNSLGMHHSSSSTDNEQHGVYGRSSIDNDSSVLKRIQCVDVEESSDSTPEMHCFAPSPSRRFQSASAALAAFVPSLPGEAALVLPAI